MSIQFYSNHQSGTMTARRQILFGGTIAILILSYSSIVLGQGQSQTVAKTGDSTANGTQESF